MGNRVLIQFKNESEVSPVIYGHWAGSEAPQIIADLRDQMADRPDDMSYIAARCVGRLIGEDKGSTGVGMWSATEELKIGDSHGDAGIFVVQVGPTWKVTHRAGYSDPVYPTHPRITWTREPRE